MRHECLNREHALIQVVHRLIMSICLIKKLLIQYDSIPNLLLIPLMRVLLYHYSLSLDTVLLVYLTKPLLSNMNLRELSMEHDASLC